MPPPSPPPPPPSSPPPLSPPGMAAGSPAQPTVVAPRTSERTRARLFVVFMVILRRGLLRSPCAAHVPRIAVRDRRDLTQLVHGWLIGLPGTAVSWCLLARPPRGFCPPRAQTATGALVLLNGSRRTTGGRGHHSARRVSA